MRLVDTEQVIRRCQPVERSVLPINMPPDEVRTVGADGLVTISAHTMSHPTLTNKSDADAATQIEQSMRLSKEWLGTTDVTAFT